MAASEIVSLNSRLSETGRERAEPFYLCCHLILTTHFTSFPFSSALPPSVTFPISTLLPPNALPVNSWRIIISPLLSLTSFIHSYTSLPILTFVCYFSCHVSLTLLIQPFALILFIHLCTYQTSLLQAALCCICHFFLYVVCCKLVIDYPCK